MKSANRRQVNWFSVIVHALYVWAFGLAVAFFGRLFGIAAWRDFVPALTVAVALATVFAAYRLGTRVRSQPILHGLLVGLLVAVSGLVLNYLTTALTVTEIAGFFMQVLGGLLGGRMAQRALESPRK